MKVSEGRPIRVAFAGRAFVNENDGWRRCVKYMEDCMMADEHGKCILDHCHQHPEKDKKENNTIPQENRLNDD